MTNEFNALREALGELRRLNQERPHPQRQNTCDEGAKALNRLSELYEPR